MKRGETTGMCVEEIPGYAGGCWRFPSLSHVASAKAYFSCVDTRELVSLLIDPHGESAP